MCTYIQLTSFGMVLVLELSPPSLDIMIIQANFFDQQQQILLRNLEDNWWNNTSMNVKSPGPSVKRPSSPRLKLNLEDSGTETEVVSSGCSPSSCTAPRSSWKTEVRAGKAEEEHTSLDKVQSTELIETMVPLREILSRRDADWSRAFSKGCVEYIPETDRRIGKPRTVVPMYQAGRKHAVERAKFNTNHDGRWTPWQQGEHPVEVAGGESNCCRPRLSSMPRLEIGDSEGCSAGQGAQAGAWRIGIELDCPAFHTIVQLYQKLRDTDPVMMPDNEFAKHLVTLMTPSEAWRYCRDTLRDKVRQGEAMQTPVSSAAVLQRLKTEEVEMGIAPSMIAINALRVGKGKSRDTGDAVPSAYAAQSSNQANRRDEKSHQQQIKRPAPFSNEQRSVPRKACSNKYCETPRGHLIEDCFSYGGGKVGRYPDSFKGKRDVHLAPEARTAARHKQALESGPGDRFAGMVEYEDEDMEEEENGAGTGDRFTGMIGHTEDTEEDVEKVIGTVGDAFAFMLGR
ncbi:hypothetical protein FB45DRAFT_1138151 [Roridomyces roridus]|uniref:Uncharacterized protein n=1 Tax=Roridomyces roridus TaxID=1738132 RepID=A0AAD7FSY9_9AGAR|nr:hypothetical protein FB45DRAFT_1138151 [Roridomyces roridus]